MRLTVCSQQFFERFRQKAVRERIPLSGTLELTRDCNLQCRHCYLSGCPAVAESRGRATGWTLDNWQGLLQDIEQAGTLYLVFTGGEPLLYPGFRTLYASAVSKGLLTTVFTNGTTLDQQSIELFRQWPPYQVEVSLYGASRAGYQKITGCGEAFDAVLAGLERLATAGIRFRLKSVLLKPLEGDLTALQALADRFQVAWRVDPAVFPSLNGSRTPLEYRMDPEKAARFEMQDARRQKDWIRYLASRPSCDTSSRLYCCGAGMTSFYVTAEGRLQPCMMVDAFSGDLRRESFATLWHNTIGGITHAAVGHSKCMACDLRLYCGICPAFAQLETGDAQAPVPYLCRLGAARRSALQGAQQSDVS